MSYAILEQQFGALLDAMSKANTWSLLDWKTTMDQQLSSWMTYIPGVSNSPQMKDLKSFQGNYKLPRLLFSAPNLTVFLLYRYTR